MPHAAFPFRAIFDYVPSLAQLADARIILRDAERQDPRERNFLAAVELEKFEQPRALILPREG